MFDSGSMILGQSTLPATSERRIDCHREKWTLQRRQMGKLNCAARVSASLFSLGRVINFALLNNAPATAREEHPARIGMNEAAGSKGTVLITVRECSGNDLAKNANIAFG